MIRLGAFKLHAPIGRGGMGEVWGGVHLESGAPVAVKVLASKNAGDTRFQRRFRNEARAVAGLDHPNIVDVYDFGEVSEEAGAMSQGRIAAGASYLVMARVGGGTLSQRRGELAWTELKAVLLSLLDALAHAHARKVIHRDLKPGNVLFGDGGDRVQLTDFGLAHAMDREGVSLETNTGAIGGTPAYMAPEQFHGDSRDVGPWSDLYALGCLVYSMVRGAPPYGRSPWLDVAAGHLYRPIPKLAPRITVPDGFEDWVRLLLAKEVPDRYQRAADAAWDLESFEDPTEELLRPVPLPATLTDTGPVTAYTGGAENRLTEGSGESKGTITATQTTLVWDREAMRQMLAHKLSAESGVGVRERATVEAPSAGSPAMPAPPVFDPETEPAHPTVPRRELRPEPPPLPFTWKVPERPRLLGQLLGLGLYPLRTIPMVDREEEREALWRGLQRTRRLGRATAVVVQGPAGAGKSRLAEWICQRAHELGAATILEAVHSSIATRYDGLGPMVLRFLRCAGLPRQDTEARVARQLQRLGITSEETVASVIELVLPSTETERATGIRKLRFHGTLERHALVRRILQQAAQQRPLVLWIDDAQWGLDALEFVQHILDVQTYAPLPVLMVLTVQEEALNPRSAEADALEAITGHPHTQRVPVGPLPAPAHRALIREMLGLEPALAARVEARTAGNPQFAVRLVGDWVQRRLLVRSGDGFRLRDQVGVELPDDLHAVWGGMVAQLLDPRPASDGVALELAAVLGRDVSVAEWNEACALGGVTPTAGLLDGLLARRLVHSRDPEMEWSFAHEMLRESLLRRAKDAGRWAAHHAACVQVVQRAEVGAPTERLARHLVEAGRVHEAVGPMLAVARGYLAAGEVRAARLMLADRERWLDRVGVSQEDRARVEGWVVHSQVARKLGLAQEASSWCNRSLGAARRSGLDGVLCDALREQAMQRLEAGDPDGAVRPLDEALELARRLGDSLRFAQITADSGAVHQARGLGDAARAAFVEAIRHYGQAGHEAEAAAAWMGLCQLAMRKRAWTRAMQWAGQARRGFEAQGSRWGVAQSLAVIGEVQRRQGNLEEAEVHLSEARARLEELGLEEPTLGVELALVWVHQGRHADARVLLRRCSLERSAPGGHGLRVQGALVACAAGLRLWSDLDRGLRALGDETSLAAGGEDLGALLEVAGELARRSGQHHRAGQVWTCAARAWDDLGDPRAALRVREWIRALPR